MTLSEVRDAVDKLNGAAINGSAVKLTPLVRLTLRGREGGGGVPQGQGCKGVGWVGGWVWGGPGRRGRGEADTLVRLTEREGGRGGGRGKGRRKGGWQEQE